MRAMAHSRPASVFNRDADEHSRYRRMMTKPFTAKRVEALRPAIQQLADEHIDAILAGPRPADLISTLALPVPSLVIGALLGVPPEDQALFRRHSEVGLLRDATDEQTRQNRIDQMRFMTRLVETKLDNPGEDAISDMAERVRAGEIDIREAAMQGVGLLIAGHETSANMVGLGTLALLENPDQAAVIREATDTRVLANAVEELLRHLSVVQNGQRRIALQDIELGDVTIRAGEGVIIDLAPANWDQDIFEHPEQIDVRRVNADRHLAFGFGRHQCVGQQLARAELQIIFGTLFRRIPTLHLATTIDRIEFKRDRLAYGVYELPVGW